MSFERPSHLAYLDGLRGLAALFVVLHHAYLTIWNGPARPEGWVGVLLAPLTFGHYAVVVFLVLSGYCLTLPVQREPAGIPRGGWKRFFLRRARRILPAYWLALITTIGLIALWLGEKTGTHWDTCLPVTIPAIVGHALLLQDLFARQIGGRIDHVYWSVAVEWHLYFLFPALLWLRRRSGATGMLTGATLVGLVVSFALRKSVLSGLTPHFLPLFALGAFAAEASPLPDSKKAAAGWCSVLGLSGLILLSGWLGAERALNQWLPLVSVDLLAGVSTALLLVSAASAPQSAFMPRLLGARLPVFLGGMAYSLYLMHAPLLQLVWQYALRPLRIAPLATFCLLIGALPLVVGGCWLFFLICERPLLQKRGASA